MKNWIEFWKAKWENLEIGFHQSEINPLLKKYFSKIKAETVFVPLCGKSKDMLWIANQGCKVIGVELSALACQSFFKENNLDFQTSNEGPFVVYDSGQIKIYCGNLFDLKEDFISKIRSVYDRAALIALPTEIRKRYVQHLRDLLHDEFRYLLVTVDYTQEKAEGPPFSVPETEVRQHFSFSSVELLSRKRDQDFARARNKFEGLSVHESCYLIRCK